MVSFCIKKISCCLFLSLRPSQFHGSDVPRVDQCGPVLLQRGLDDVGREHVPHEVHESVGRGHVSARGAVALVVQVFSLAGPRSDGGDEGDAQEHREQGGHHVVDYGAPANLPTEAEVWNRLLLYFFVTLPTDPPLLSPEN